jgi:glucose-1-phosphate thymidylyltransferase
MKAVIMAAGEGRRLEPLTDVRPKPMLPIANKPLLEYVIQAVVESGVDEIILVTGYQRERIQNHFGTGDDWGAPIQYAVQEKQLGTGHAILQAESLVDGSFLVLNGDRILEPQIFEQLLRMNPNGDAVLAVTRSDQPSEYGVVQLEGESVHSIVEKPARATVKSDLINAGVYLFSDGIFDVIRSTEPVGGELTVTAALEKLAMDDLVSVVPYDGIWLDVTHHWDILRVNAEIIDRDHNPIKSLAAPHPSSVISPNVVIGSGTIIQPNATLGTGTAIGENVRIGANTVIENSVVFSDAIVEAGAVVRDSVIAENTSVGANSTIEGGLADVVVDGTVHPEVRLGSVIGDHSVIGANVTITPGTIIGAGVEVGSGCRLSGRIPSNAIVRGG